MFSFIDKIAVDWVNERALIPPKIIEVEKIVSSRYNILDRGVSLIQGACGGLLEAFKYADSFVFGDYSRRALICRAVCLAGLGHYAWNRRETVRDFFQRRLAKLRVVRMSSSSNSNFNLEAKRVGSEEGPMLAQKTQAVVGVARGNVFEAMGGAHRLVVGGSEFLITPKHVIDACLLLGDVLIKGPKDVIRLPDVEPELILTDVYAYKLSEDFFTRIGLRVSSINGFDDSRPPTVHIAGCDNRGTISTVKHDVMFGYVEYSGSTFAGYSGCGYYLGNKLVGIHLMAIKDRNVGVSSSYVLCVLRSVYGIREESSEDWLRGIKLSKQDVAFDHISEAGYIRIRVRGTYHEVKQDNMRSVFGEDWFKDNVRGYRDEDSTQIDTEYNCRSVSTEAKSIGELGFHLPRLPQLVDSASAQAKCQLESEQSLEAMMKSEKLSKKSQVRLQLLKQLLSQGIISPIQLSEILAKEIV